MREIFVVSDTHFGHANMLKFTDEKGDPVRKFKDVTEMNEIMINNWNNTVSPEDIVYHLGDVYFGSQQSADRTLSRLNGRKRLVLGNHDKGKDTVLLKHFQKISLWRIFKEFNLILSHIPLHPDSFRAVEYNAHGHIHQKTSPSKFHKNVCVEKTSYTPINIEDIIKNQ